MDVEDRFHMTTLNKTVLGDTHAIFIQRVLLIFSWIVFCVLCPLIGIIGIGTNILNIMCFVKQGFKDQINISLLGTAISDLGSLVTSIWTTLSFFLPFCNLDLSFDPVEVQHMISGMPHTVFSRITAWITAFITFERCLCIAVPLKVKEIITNKRVTTTIIFIFLIMIIGQSPVYVVNKLDWKYFPHRNKTLIGLVSMGDHTFVESISYIVNNVVLNFVAFVVIIVCTLTLSIQLYIKTKWRIQSTNDTTLSKQNKSVAKVVVMISVIFIACFIPISVVFIFMSLDPEYSVSGKYSYVVLIAGGCGLILESLNSSVNILVYYYMSTKYRHAFQDLFTKAKK